MHTIQTARAETRTLAIPAPPAAVLAVIADPLRLPEWAPGSLPPWRPTGDLWRIDSGGTELLVEVQVVEAAGTVDLLRPGGDTTIGARMRAIGSGDGTELLFTILFPDRGRRGGGRPRRWTSSRRSWRRSAGSPAGG